MFQPNSILHIKPAHLRRVSFVSKLYPRINSSLGVDTKRLRATDVYDGSLFGGGRSKNKDLLTYFGCIAASQKGASTFVQLPLFRRSLKKLVQLVESELELAGAQEVLLPTIVPLKLWTKSKRLERQTDALNNVYSFKDHSGTDLLLGPTYEESITQLVSDLSPPVASELPLMLYQTSSKFRYEPNPRFGLLRSNEFLMNDLYSFDMDIEHAKETYERMTNIYHKIFNRLSLNCIRFESVTGNIGGKYSHEYQLPVSSGEDQVIRCHTCQYNYNIELYHGKSNQKCIKCESSDVEMMQTLELAHTFMLSDTYSQAMNMTLKCADGTRAYYEMGCYGLGLTRILGAGIDLFSIIPDGNSQDGQDHYQIRWPTEVEPYKLGIVSPARRSKQYQGGSAAFIEQLVCDLMESTHEVDILIEDRDKEGIHRRISKLKSLGIPNIIIVGQRFLQSIPEVEFLRLDSKKRYYEQLWLTKDQACDLVRRLER